MNPPSITAEQRSQALAKAAEVRKNRAKIKADLKNNELTVGELLERIDDPLVGGMKVSEVLLALPGVGKTRAGAIMDKIGTIPNRRLRGLGSQQRRRLFIELI